jgi:hypothetical protein
MRVQAIQVFDCALQKLTGQCNAKSKGIALGRGRVSSKPNGSSVRER